MSNPHPNTILFARGTLARLALWPALRLAVHASWGGPASTEKQRWLASVLVDQFEPFILAPPLVLATSESSRTGSLSPATAPPPDAFYVEELLLQIMTDEFDVVLEDESAAAVARDIITLFGAVCTGDETFVTELEAQAERVKGKMPKYEMGAGSESESGSGSGSDWEDEDDQGEEEPVPQLLDHLEPQIDEDGFTMVKKKGRR